jgi:hypothetical protein
VHGCPASGETVRMAFLFNASAADDAIGSYVDRGSALGSRPSYQRDELRGAISLGDDSVADRLAQLLGGLNSEVNLDPLRSKK